MMETYIFFNWCHC